MTQIQMTLDRELASTALSEQQKLAIYRNAEASRMEVARQFPTFYRKQLQDMVASNAFSVSQIATTWTNGIANSNVKGGDFAKAAWQATQVAIIQGALNTGIQLAAQWALRASVEMGIVNSTNAQKVASFAGMEALKTTISAEGDTARMAATIFTAKTAQAAIIIGILATGEAMIAVMGSVVTAIAGIFAAIGAGLLATIVGAPFAASFAAAAGAVIVAGTTALIAAQAALTAAGTAALAGFAGPGFASGGIGDFGKGTQATLHGQEAIIPLNSRGASFMQEAMGGRAGGGDMTVVLQMDGREIARRTMEYMPGIIYMKTGMA